MLPGDRVTRVPKVVVGTSAVALILAATRWGSYIGVSPVFLTDVLLFLGLAQWFLLRQRNGQAPRDLFVARDRPGLPLTLFFCYVLTRIVVALAQDVSIGDWVRDSAPFLYSFLAFVSAASIARSTKLARDRSARVFMVALTAHLVWATFSIFTRFAGFPLAGGAAAVFQIRPDIDMAVLGIGSGMFLLRAFRTKKRFWPIVAIFISLADVLSLQSRAGLLSVVASLLVAYLIFYAGTPARSGRRLFSQMLVPLALAAAIVVLPQTGPGQRLVATIDSSSATTAQQLSAQGTEQARRLVWTRVIEWTNETPSRQIFGSGFGNDFLSESGTLSYLEGTTYENVRSPHNYFIGIYARMGLVGVFLVGGVILSLVLTVFRRLRVAAEDDVIAIASLIVLAILPVASLGVVLEAPFGAVPFWWAAGIVLTTAPQRQSALDSHKRRALPLPRSTGDFDSAVIIE
ncbi:O-antigen ligase [Curtobacterium sp. VKM Ac-2922]|uniref:O-antigen ligase family protein n=1 Tax=Curtobacterium sp. VKM Ac-2922 TaxID=2929475 RepID=UPI001FB49B3E|nr:O-antigen ligase family protein [Curtobacterium sp. VKM Ac-2922]MCJ1714154.1 O-antigen ligase family protein [Curtobacterium sp. VKM Ac-2922]